MVTPIDAPTLKTWLSDGREMALLDVREHGQFGEGHLFFAVPLPYSRFELALPSLAPNPDVRLVLCGDGTDTSDAVAARAAARAAALGYRDVFMLAGGMEAWRRAGYTLYAGVNVPSKTFGELVEHHRHTPRVTAEALEAMRDAGEDVVVIDGRPFAEYQKMTIPGSICCPNGELTLRIRDIVPSPTTKVVVNCAGRTRSIIGAQTLIDFGIPNPVYALENGTQGWFLAGLGLEHGARRRYPDDVEVRDVTALGVRARALAEAHGVRFVTAEQANQWLANASRTTYLLDIRTAEEVAALPVPGFAHAPGGQLIQATDQWIAVRGARLVLVDEEAVRAPVVAAWLRQLGHDACVIEGGIAAAGKLTWRRPARVPPVPALGTTTPRELAEALARSTARVIDLRHSMAYRKEHIPQAMWSIRPRIAAAAAAGGPEAIVLVADEPQVAALAALDLAEAGFGDVRLLSGGQEAWRRVGLPVTSTPCSPCDADCIDFLFFTHARHDGNADAARQYLAWEIGLVDQLDAQERGAFRLAGPT